MRAIIGPQNIASVTVAMQPDIAHSSRALIAVCDAFQRVAREAVLFEYRVIAPAPRPIDLRNQHHAVFEPHLVDAVLKAVKRILPAVAAITAAFDGVEYQIGREILVGWIRHGRCRTYHSVAMGIAALNPCYAR